MKQPMLPMVLVFLAGILLGRQVECILFPSFAAAFILGIAGLVWEQRRFTFLCALLFLAGWIIESCSTLPISPNDLRRLIGDGPEQVTVQGVLDGMTSPRHTERNGDTNWHTLAAVRVKAVRIGKGEWQPADGIVQTTTPGLIPYHYKQQVEVSGVAARPPVAHASGLFDYRSFLETQGIYYEMRMESDADWRIIGKTNAMAWTEKFRLWAQQILATGLPEQDKTLELQWAMMLGWKTALTENVSETFMRSGTMHIFAISGLHIAMISLILMTLLRSFGIPSYLCGWVVIPLIWFYTGATEWQASAIRSTIMTTVVILSWSIQRPGTLLNSLAIAALIILAYDPQQLFQVGFQLSFAAVASMAALPNWLNTKYDAYFRPKSPDIAHLTVKRTVAMQKKHALFIRRITKHKWIRIFNPLLEWWRGLHPDPLLPTELQPKAKVYFMSMERIALGSVCVTLGATLGTFPLIACYFHVVTPVSLLANLVAVPLSGLALMCGMGSLAFGAWFPLATELFNHAGWFFMHLMIQFSEWSIQLPSSSWFVPSPHWVSILLYYGILILVFWYSSLIQWRKGIYACIALLALSWLSLHWSGRKTTVVTILPLQQGDAIWICGPETRNRWLIDCGDVISEDRVTRPFLRAQGVNVIPNFVLTHGDIKQIGGGSNLMNQFKVEKLCISPIRFRSAPYIKLVSLWTNQNKSVCILHNQTNTGPWQILHPHMNDKPAQADDNTLVMRGVFGGTRLLLCSELGAAGQNALYQRHDDLQADIVVTGLPRGTHPLHDELLAKIQPKVIIVADSDRPALARASHELKKRLRRSGALVFFQSESYAITITLRPNEWTLSDMLGNTLHSSEVH